MKKTCFLLFILVFAAACSQKPLNYPNSGRNIVAFGDSLTAGYGAAEGKSYPALLAAKQPMPVINLGVSGDTARMGANRKEEIRRHNPYMVLIEFGGNDAMRGRPFSETEKALREIVDYVQSLGAIAVIVDTGGNFKMNPYTKMMKSLAKEKGAVFVPEIMDGIFYNAALKSDSVHPNEKGYEKIADKVLKNIKKYLK